MKSHSTSVSQQILEHIDLWTASHPKILWIELTSKCPFQCLFCMRKESRHPGEHMDFGLLQRILEQLRSPEIIRLNNAGESIHYPHLIDAIRMSKRTGARIELVTTLASAPLELLPELMHSGLDQLTVSLHAIDPVQYQRIYGFASFDALDQRLRRLLQQRAEEQSSTPGINISFVATKENLQALPQVSHYAQELGIDEIQVHRVIWRDPAKQLFTYELHSNRLTPAFRQELEETVERTRCLFPGLALVYANNALDAAIAPGEQPAFFSQDLPSGCCIADCIENPWETVNIYSNGDILACGCRSSQQALGNLNSQSLTEVWWGSSFRHFRAEYFLGQDQNCCQCPWKKIFVPTTFHAELPHSGGWSWQLMRGWYHEEKSPAIWSKPEAAAMLASNGTFLRPKISLTGFLPNPTRATPNRLEVFCNGIPAGSVVNHNHRMLEFAMTIPVPSGTDPPYCLQFKTEKCYCPNQHEDSPDIRRLGFALCRLAVVGEKRSRAYRLWAGLFAK